MAAAGGTALARERCRRGKPPTGSGKTLILSFGQARKNRGPGDYTVPLVRWANDKLAEWRARGWDVGIATGDLRKT